MTDIILPRRKFLTGLLGIVAAPAVVKATSLMPVKLVDFGDGVALKSMAHPVRTGSGICLSELREILRPGLEKMVDDMYAENPGQWKHIFVSEGQ
jgi:hypothetical protein